MIRPGRPQYPLSFKEPERDVARNFSNSRRVRYFVINSADLSVTNYKTSSDFTCRLPEALAGADQRNIESIALFSGSIPNIFTITGTVIRPFLYLVIPQLQGEITSNNLENNASAVLLYNILISETSTFLELGYSYELVNIPVNKGFTNKMDIRILTPEGSLYDFTNSIYYVTLVTTGTSTTFTIGANVIALGDLIYIRNFQNASTQAMKETIVTATPYKVTGVTGTTVTVAINTTSEAANQPPTGTPPAYPLGQGVTFYDQTNGKSFAYITGVSSFSTTNPTIFNTGGLPHGFTTGDQVLIAGFKNGNSSVVNSLMNIVQTVTVTSTTTFTIPVDLSGQTASQQTTGTQAPYPLGQGSYILPDNRQVTFLMKATILPMDNPENVINLN